MNFFLLINVKMPTLVAILTFMSRKKNIQGLSEPETKKQKKTKNKKQKKKKTDFFLIFLYSCAFKILCSDEFVKN